MNGHTGTGIEAVVGPGELDLLSSAFDDPILVTFTSCTAVVATPNVR